MLHGVSNQYMHASTCLCCVCVLAAPCVHPLEILSKTVSCTPLFYLIAVLAELTAEMASEGILLSDGGHAHLL